MKQRKNNGGEKENTWKSRIFLLKWLIFLLYFESTFFIFGKLILKASGLQDFLMMHLQQ